MNRLWRLNERYLAAYTEDTDVMRKIRRSYPDFWIMAEYSKDGVIYALQYRVPSERKRSARHLLGVNVDR
ncbi:hypothetical protein FE782_03710 [Paenibacillus antri]|uniref:Uncharacterized protein n=1 Tax=Paenibacillus antri TaxID=2582848 RepID=A0A5R9GJ00_9BACL|nr:hypothetical protein [Paenibacillus antri]TLS53388.1 hypothetical protein FE782_03710 [Paenibacillus antri]